MSIFFERLNQRIRQKAAEYSTPELFKTSDIAVNGVLGARINFVSVLSNNYLLSPGIYVVTNVNIEQYLQSKEITFAINSTIGEQLRDEKTYVSFYNQQWIDVLRTYSLSVYGYDAKNQLILKLNPITTSQMESMLRMINQDPKY